MVVVVLNSCACIGRFRIPVCVCDTDSNKTTPIVCTQVENGIGWKSQAHVLTQFFINFVPVFHPLRVYWTQAWLSCGSTMASTLLRRSDFVIIKVEWLLPCIHVCTNYWMMQSLFVFKLLWQVNKFCWCRKGESRMGVKSQPDGWLRWTLNRTGKEVKKKHKKHIG